MNQFPGAFRQELHGQQIICRSKPGMGIEGPTSARNTINAATPPPLPGGPL